MSEDDDLPRGPSLQEAFLQWSDPADLKRLRHLPARSTRYCVYSPYLGHPPRMSPFPDPALRRERERIEARLIWAFCGRLRSGELVATGLEAPLKVTSRRIVVARHLWEALQPRFSTSSAEGGGLKIIRIEVLEASVLGSSIGTAASVTSRPHGTAPPRSGSRTTTVS